MQEEITLTTLVLQTLSWLIALLLLSVALVYFIRRSAALQREVTTRSSAMDRAAEDQIAAKEWLLAREAELDRQRVDWEKQLASLADEKEQERQRYEGLFKEYTQLQVDLAKALRLDKLTRERDSARDQLDLLRKEKSAVDATLAALQSRMEEEHKATEECTRLHAKIETTAREAAQTKIDEPTTERNSGREQLDLFA
jgi:chromosome segregation ATPase